MEDFYDSLNLWILESILDTADAWLNRQYERVLNQEVDEFNS